MNNDLKKELDFFKANQESLVAQYSGKFLVIANESIFGAYDTEIEAYEEATKELKLGTFIIQECISGDSAYTQTFHSRVMSIG